MPTVLFYVAGHLLLAVLVFLAVRLYRVIRPRPALGTRLKDVIELTKKEARIRAAEAEIKRSHVELKTIDEDLEKAECKYRNHIQLDDPLSVMLLYAVLALILGEAETALLWLLNASSQFFGLSWEWWALLAPALSAAVILAFHVVIGWAVTDQNRPARSVRNAKIGTGLCGLAVLIGFYLLLSGRSLSDASVIEKLAGIGLAILVALLSLTAAFCSKVVIILWDEQQPERGLQKLQERRHDYLRHLDELEKDLERLRPDPPYDGPPMALNVPVDKPGPQGGTPRVRNIAPGALMLILALALPLTSRAQSTMISVPAPKPIPLARAGSCEFLVDMTGSLNRDALRRALTSAGREMTGIAAGFRCSVIRITPFADSIFDQIDEIALPPVNRENDCGTKAAAVSGHPKPAEIMFPVVKTAHHEKAMDECMATHQKQRDAALSQVGERLLVLADRNQHGSCTALPQAIQRGLVRSQHIISITDGVATCASPSRIAPIPTDSDLLFLLVPTTDSGNAARANNLVERLAMLERVYRGSRALLAPEATHAFWLQLAGPRASGIAPQH